MLIFSKSKRATSKMESPHNHIQILGECPKLCRGASSCLMPVCHSQVLKTDHSSHIQWVLFSRRNALAHRFLLLSDMFLILWCMLLSSAYFVQNAGGYNVTIGIRSMFGKKGNFGPRLVSLILHLAACSSLLSLFSLFSLISLSLSLSSLLSLLCLSASLLSLFSLSLSLVSCLFSLIFLLFLLFLFFLLSLSLSLLLCSRGACRGRVSKPITLVPRPVPRPIPRPKP